MTADKYLKSKITTYENSHTINWVDDNGEFGNIDIEYDNRGGFNIRAEYISFEKLIKIIRSLNMEDKYETLGQLIDDLDDLTYALNIPMSDEFHVKQLKKILPKKVQDLKEVFIEITGENPWK